jgi:HEPN domain-containing protein
MSAPLDEQLTEARRWLTEAKEDLEWARLGPTHPDLVPRVACFLAHLAAEKALKGLLVAEGTSFQKIHGLTELRSGLSSRTAALFDVDDLAALEPWNIAGRYAADVPDADDALATRIVDVTATILARAETALAMMQHPDATDSSSEEVD